jgi:hypothetical protein
MARTTNEAKKKKIRVTYNEEHHVIGKANITKNFPYVMLHIV